MIEIDGSYGEGGGQILRTSLSLSCLYRKPFRIFNIRKSRKRPGLMPQHLTCVRASQMLSDADVKGDFIGSTELFFCPKTVRGGKLFFDVGTAGSTSLILQTLIPSLIFLENETEIILTGGTHVPFSPSFHYINGVFVPLLKKIGIEVSLNIDSFGFYPRGGGRIRAKIFSAPSIKPLNLVERGVIKHVIGCSGVGNLPLSIAERQRLAFMDEIKGLGLPVDIEIINVPATGQGTFIYVQSEAEFAIAGFTSLGQRGKRAEEVGKEVAREFLDYYESNAAIDPHLSDQICIYLSLCKEPSIFTTSLITSHLITNLWVINQFKGIRYSIEGEIGRKGTVSIN